MSFNAYCFLKYLIYSFCIAILGFIVVCSLLIIEFSPSKTSTPPYDHVSHYDDTQQLKQKIIDQFRSQASRTKTIRLTSRDLVTLQNETRQHLSTGSNCKIELNVDEQNIEVQLRHPLTSWASIRFSFDLIVQTQLVIEQVRIGGITLPKPLSDTLIGYFSTRRTGLGLEDIEKVIRLAEVRYDAAVFEVRL